jgi:hypothetical protein
MGDNVVRKNLLHALEMVMLGGEEDPSVHEVLAEAWDLYELSYFKRSTELVARATSNIVQLGVLYLKLDDEDIRDLGALLR